MVFGEERDDAICFPKFLGTQNNCLITVDGHGGYRSDNYERKPRFTADTTALSEAVVVLGSIPTPQ